jgi:(p)ppGpp synthase/HD superfamily hydrolase
MKFLEIPIVSRAKMAAVFAHESVGQTRKYGQAHYGPERYYFHPCKVAELVATVTDDEQVIAAAALHDVLEDVSVKSEVFTPRWLCDQFGPRILFYVLECTNVYTKDADQRRVVMETLRVLDSEMFSVAINRHLAENSFKVADTSNREQRKRLEAERYAGISESAKIIKRADLFDNSLSMDGAPASFVEKWMAEKDYAESLIGSWRNYEALVHDARRANMPVPV